MGSKSDLVNLQTEVDKLDIDKLKNVPTNLSNLKSKVDKSDIDKAAPVPVDLSKLSNVVKNEIVKKTEYIVKIKNIEDKIHDITNLAIKNALYAYAKINEVKAEIPIFSGFATTSALTAVESKIPDVNNLVKKVHYNTIVNETEKKITDHSHGKYLTTAEFNKPTAENFEARLALTNLVTKTDFDNKLSGLNRKITSNKTKHLVVENELKN